MSEHLKMGPLAWSEEAEQQLQQLSWVRAMRWCAAVCACYCAALPLPLPAVAAPYIYMYCSLH